MHAMHGAVWVMAGCLVVLQAAYERFELEKTKWAHQHATNADMATEAEMAVMVTNNRYNALEEKLRMMKACSVYPYDAHMSFIITDIFLVSVLWTECTLSDPHLTCPSPLPIGDITIH